MITDLHLFEKNTDAAATEKGFHYQHLKTVENWLHNRINNINQEIYCDYQDDIFVKDPGADSLQFRQIKLYSSNFSFSSEEIKKTIIHFFLLFVKHDPDSKITFVFDTNTSISPQNTLLNDADLLRSWYAEQENLSAEVFTKCVTKVQEIINEYINHRIERSAIRTQSDMDKAMRSFQDLTLSHWKTFVRSIRWQFDSLSKDEAMLEIEERIGQLINRLPLSFENNERSICLPILNYEVIRKTINTFPTEKRLTNQQLDVLILRKGSVSEQNYAELYEHWSTVNHIDSFALGSFYEIIHSIKYFGDHLKESEHGKVWAKVLKLYIDFPEIDIAFKRTAIFFYFYAKYLIYYRENGHITLIKYELEERDYIRFYFTNLENRLTDEDIRNDIYLLRHVDLINLAEQERQKNMSSVELIQNIFDITISSEPGVLEALKPERYSPLTKLIPIQGEEIFDWKENLIKYLDISLANEQPPSRLCQFAELRAYAFFTFPNAEFHILWHDAKPYFELIRENLEQASAYNSSRLYWVFEKILTSFDSIEETNSDLIVEDELIYVADFLQFLSTVTNNVSGKRNLFLDKHKFASLLFQKKKQQLQLMGLHAAHEARKIAEELNDRKLRLMAVKITALGYNNLGLYLAGKSYGLAAFRLSDENEENQHIGFDILSTVFIIISSNYLQGSWKQVIQDTKVFTICMIAYNSRQYSPTIEFAKAAISKYVRFIHTCAVKFGDPYLSVFPTVYTPEGWQQMIDSNFNDAINLQSEITDPIEFANYLTENFNLPFNDVGRKRTLTFNALGIVWIFKYENTYALNCAAEEFAAALQIVIAEIKRLNEDLLSPAHRCTFEIEVGDYGLHLSKASSTGYFGKIDLPQTGRLNMEDSMRHVETLNRIIEDIFTKFSLLPDKSVTKIFDRLNHGENLIRRIYANTRSYQTMYSFYQKPEEFIAINDEGQPTNWTGANGKNIPEFLPLPERFSNHFKKEEILQMISWVYEQTSEILKIVLPAWKNDSQFLELITSLREAEWLDWQILFMIFTQLNQNTELSEKLRESQPFQFPSELLNVDHFWSHMTHFPSLALRLYGLENKLNYDPLTLRFYLNEKVDLNKLDLQELNPLREI